MTANATIEESMDVANTIAMPDRLTGLPRAIRRAIDRTARLIEEDFLEASAVIFAPHQDDETLGCGGLILRKRDRAGDVTVVFLTDGAQSHDGQVSRAALAARRNREGANAVRLLGVADSDVIALDHPDGGLANCEETAVRNVSNILAERKPKQVFVTSARDATADHQAAARIVQTAVRRALPEAELFAYPIWYWCYWPFARAKDAFDRSWPQRYLRLVRSMRAMRQSELYRFPLDGVRESKWAALNAHVSQMQRDPNHPDWPTLGDVWGGGFLRCFFDENEIFARIRS